jgi:hypothetical protein
VGQPQPVRQPALAPENFRAIRDRFQSGGVLRPRQQLRGLRADRPEIQLPVKATVIYEAMDGGNDLDGGDRLRAD